MKIIAFKRAGDKTPSLHPLFITEWIDASLLESTVGYETMVQEHFELELAKNPERHESHGKYLKELEKAKIAAQQAEANKASAEEKQLQREFEIFKRWKQNQKKV